MAPHTKLQFSSYQKGPLLQKDPPELPPIRYSPSYSPWGMPPNLEIAWDFLSLLVTVHQRGGQGLKITYLCVGAGAVKCKKLEKSNIQFWISEKWTSNFKYPDGAWPYRKPMGHSCKIWASCDHCYGRDWQKFEKFGKIELRISNIRIVKNLPSVLVIIHANL